jgi:hypothetical protein
MSRMKASRRMHRVRIPPPPPRPVYLAAEDAKKVEDLIFLIERQILVVATWATCDSDCTDEEFAVLRAMTRWACSFELPESLEDFWSSPSILERKSSPTAKDLKESNGHMSGARVGAPNAHPRIALMKNYSEPTTSARLIKTAIGRHSV